MDVSALCGYGTGNGLVCFAVMPPENASFDTVETANGSDIFLHPYFSLISRKFSRIARGGINF